MTTAAAEPERQRVRLGRISGGDVGGLDRWLSLAGGGGLAAFGIYRLGSVIARL